MSRRLTVALPDEVWDRLNAEAQSKGMTIGTFARKLLLARDERVQQTNNQG